jgi:hypothetical protein
MLYTPYIGFYDKEYCEVCEETEIEINCNKCASGVCRNEQCCVVFPHHKNTEFVVCNECKEIIDKKLQKIDLGKITLLKRKIATHTTIKHLRMTPYVKPTKGGNYRKKN